MNIDPSMMGNIAQVLRMLNMGGSNGPVEPTRMGGAPMMPSVLSALSGGNGAENLPTKPSDTVQHLIAFVIFAVAMALLVMMIKKGRKETAA